METKEIQCCCMNDDIGQDRLLAYPRMSLGEARQTETDVGRMEYTRYVVCKFRASETRISDRFHSSDIHFRVAPCLL